MPANLFFPPCSIVAGHSAGSACGFGATAAAAMLGEESAAAGVDPMAPPNGLISYRGPSG
ncbi:MAG: hypothetical protein CM1200mP2_39410 [Planctomycetaceae bacterium]|nr:MAG: hypothetical protein CM1200mP2_39410 [Planctomycetaceae bacterium]